MKTDFVITRNFQLDKNRIIGIIIIVFCLVLVMTYSSVLGLILNFVATNLSSDQTLKEVTIADIEHYYAYFLILLGVSGLVILLNLYQKSLALVSSIIDFRKINNFLLTDEATSGKKLPVYLLLISSLAGIFTVVAFSFFPRPEQEGFLEALQSFLLVASSVVLIVSAIKSPGRIILPLISLALIFLLMFAEEISWGQRFLGYTSPEFFDKHNYQSELNIHNFFNPVYDIIYKIFGITFFLVLILVWFFRKENHSPLFMLFLPPQSLSFLVFLTACTTFSNRESFEILFYTFLLLYSIRIYFCIKEPVFKPANAQVEAGMSSALSNETVAEMASNYMNEENRSEPLVKAGDNLLNPTVIN